MSRLTDLPRIDIGARRDAIVAAVADADIDVLVVTTPMNIRWASGFTGSNGVLFVQPDGWILHTDSRYSIQAPRQLGAGGAEAKVMIGLDPWADVVKRFAGMRVGVEADSLSWTRARELIEVRGRDEVVATSELIERLRVRKDAAELARIRAAAEVVDEALTATLPHLRPGTTELDIARRLDDEIRSRGAAGPAYDTIVAGGPNSALPHATPGERPFETGDLVVVDAGAEVDGYRSDMTRSFVIGDPTADQQRHLDVVRDAQRAGLAAVTEGATGADIDKAARDVIVDAGWGKFFEHGTGHGVGLDIHELPRVNSRATDGVPVGAVITVEPGVYLPDLGGVRWEDLVVVTDGEAELLTHSAKDPVL